MIERIFLLGADGFIGRQVAFALRAEGVQVVACARRPERLARMGFATFRADLLQPQTHQSSFWEAPLKGIDAVINCAGLLTGSQAAFEAVHLKAPNALYRAMPEGCQAVLLSAVGIDEAQTPFARIRRAAEAAALEAGVTVLRAGLVLGETSHGGSSLARALAALPFAIPVVGDGTQRFNPLHGSDLAAFMLAVLREGIKGRHEVAGPEHLSQADMARALRAWLGLPEAPVLRLPLALARGLGAMGDALRLGPISRTAVDQLAAGVEADTDLDEELA